MPGSSPPPKAAPETGATVAVTTDPRGRGRWRRRARHRHRTSMGQENDGLGPASRRSGPTRSTATRPDGGIPRPLCCTAFRPTAATRSPTRSSTVRTAWCGTRRRTGCTPRRRCWSGCWSPDDPHLTETTRAGRQAQASSRCCPPSRCTARVSRRAAGRRGHRGHPGFTLSRDLEELGAGETRAPTAGPAPIVPEDGSPVRGVAGGTDRLSRLLGDLGVDRRQCQSSPCCAPRLGPCTTWPAPIDRAALPEVVGTIAGDDTIFVVVPRADDRCTIGRHLRDHPLEHEKQGSIRDVRSVIPAYSGGLTPRWRSADRQETGRGGGGGHRPRSGRRIWRWVRQRAPDCGAAEAVVVDARDEFAEQYCRPPSRATRCTWTAIRWCRR